MTPDQCKANIKREYDRLKLLAKDRKINATAIEHIIVNACRDAARHNGIPECWREYLPEGCEI